METGPSASNAYPLGSGNVALQIPNLDIKLRIVVSVILWLIILEEYHPYIHTQLRAGSGRSFFLILFASSMKYIIAVCTVRNSW